MHCRLCSDVHSTLCAIDKWHIFMSPFHFSVTFISIHHLFLLLPFACNAFMILNICAMSTILSVYTCAFFIHYTFMCQECPEFQSRLNWTLICHSRFLQHWLYTPRSTWFAVRCTPYMPERSAGL